MPLIEVRQLSAHTRMGLWRMDETPARLCSLFPHLSLLPMPFKNEGRQKEYLCVRALLKEMTGREDLLIDHLPSGKPVVEGYHVSISHTRGYAVLILSDAENVAVDIEYRSDRVGRIAHKFVRPDEPCTSLDDLLLVWSAKETLYKLHSDDKLEYFEMRSSAPCEGRIPVENMKKKKVVSISFEFTDDYVLTFAVEPLPA